MASKIIAQIVIGATQVFGRAFAEAYRNAAAQGAKNAAASGPAAARNTSNAVNKLTAQTGMSFEEAAKILNVGKNATHEELMKNYTHLFEANDKKVGGSHYLQSKVVRAKERIEMENNLTRKKGDPIDVTSEDTKQQ